MFNLSSISYRDSSKEECNYPNANYWYVNKCQNETFPVFMKDILNSQLIPEDKKILFVNNFCKRYLSDSDFRKENNGKYLVFRMGIFIKIIDNDLEFYKNCCNIITIRIGDNIIEHYGYCYWS